MRHLKPRPRSRPPPRSARRAAAFTLIEVLIVCAVVLILMSLLVPTIGMVRRAAKAMACAANLRQIGIAALAYASDFHGFVPMNPGDDRPSVLYHPTWAGMLYGAEGPSYLDNARIFNCPSSPHRPITDLKPHADMMEEGSYGVGWQNPYHRPVDPPSGPGYWNDYQMNAAWRIQQAWRNPTNSIYVAECFIWFRSVLQYPSAESDPDLSWGSSHWHSYDYGKQWFLAGAAVRTFADRHNGTNCLFLDGRVERMRTQDLERSNSGDPDCCWDVY